MFISWNPFTFTGSKASPVSGVDLKKLYDQGKLPSVKKGFYGDTLNKNNVTREHLVPKSQGGTFDEGNIVLASRNQNNARQNDDISKHADIQKAHEYLDQFKEVKTPELDGESYIEKIVETLKLIWYGFWYGSK